ncbi:MAG: glycosyltransferase family 2 protein [Acidobacteria bacterium]|nr:MAG: glycosyltransferase family 2 protein [Acidobacteriota bacterium]
MASADQVTVLIPAFNEASAIGHVIEALRPAGNWREIIVVDDGSTDGTATAAAAAGATVIRHPYNKGNGAAIKSGLRAAQGEFVLILDADGQHQPSDAARLIAPLGDYDLVIGARTGSMQASWQRRLGNSLLNWLASYLTGRHIPDLTSGMRAGRRACLMEFIHLLPNGFSTPTTTTLSFIKAGYNVRFEPISVEMRVGTSKIKLARDGSKFVLIIIRVMTIFSPLRVFLPVSAASFFLGAAYAVWTIATQRHVTNSSVLLIVLAVLLFAVGLVSEQIATLRFDGRK